MTSLPREIGYPRVERNSYGQPIWNQGPLGMGPALAACPLPDHWPADWPKDGVIDGADPRVTRYFTWGEADRG